MDSSTSPDNAPPVGQAPPTFGSKLSSLGKSAFQETKRGAHLAALKGKIEKLKHLDLPNAHHALGKKAYELRVSPETLGSRYEEIAALVKQVEEKRAGVHGGDDAKAIERIKNTAISAKMKVEAEVLERKLRQELIAVGQQVQGLPNSPEVNAELDILRTLDAHLAELQKEFNVSSADKTAQQEIKGASKAMAAQVGSGVSSASKAGGSLLGKVFSKKLILRVGLGIVVIILVAIIAAIAGGGHAHVEQQVDQSSTWGVTVGPNGVGFQRGQSYSGPGSQNPMRPDDTQNK